MSMTTGERGLSPLRVICVELGDAGLQPLLPRLAAGALTMALSFPSAAPQCISFVWLMLAGLRSVVGWVRGGRTLRIACAGECRPRAGGAWGSPCTSPCCRFSQVPFSLNLSSFFFSFFFFFSNFIFFMFCFSSVVKQWLEGVKVHLGSGKQCPWPAMEMEQIYKNLSQLFFSVLRNWQDCKEEKVSTAAVPARDGSGDTRVRSSACAQRAESRRVMRGSGLALQRAPNWLYKNLSQLFFSVLRNWQDCKEEKVSTAAVPARDGSGDTRVRSSACAQRAESRRVMRGSGLALQRAPNWLCAVGWISLPGSSRVSQRCGRDSWG